MSEKLDIPLRAVLNSAEISKEYSKAEFLINTLLNDPQKSECFQGKAIKGVRSNFFHIVNLGEISLHNINTDDNGAYTQTRNTSTMFYCNDKNVRTVYKDVEKLYFSEKVSFNTYQKTYVSKKDVVTLHRRYCKAKSFPLKRIVVTISNYPIIPYAAVLMKQIQLQNKLLQYYFMATAKRNPVHTLELYKKFYQEQRISLSKELPVKKHMIRLALCLGEFTNRVFKVMS